jgi:hypothetical protein
MRPALALFALLSAGLSAQTADGILDFPSTVVCPHAAWGGGWSSTIYITGVNTTASYTLRFHDAAGNAVRVPLVTSSGLSGTVSEITVTPANGGTETVELTNTGAATAVGWITVRSSSTSRAQIYEVFRQSVANQTPVSAFVSCTAPVAGGFARQFTFDNRNNGETGVAVVNPIAALTGHSLTDSTATTIICFADGVEVGRAAAHEPAERYAVWPLTSRIPAAAGKMGHCRVSANFGMLTAGPIVAALQFPSGGGFSTVPVSSR